MSVEVPYIWTNGRAGTTLVDDDTVELIGHKTLRRHGSYIFLGSQQIHRLVMGCVRNDGLICHHINEDTTDNRRENIKILRSKLEHGSEPHPWRNRFSSLCIRFGHEEAEHIYNAERVAAGFRPEVTVPLYDRPRVGLMRFSRPKAAAA